MHRVIPHSCHKVVVTGHSQLSHLEWDILGTFNPAIQGVNKALIYQTCM